MIIPYYAPVGGNKPRILTGMHIQVDSCKSLAGVTGDQIFHSSQLE